MFKTIRTLWIIYLNREVIHRAEKEALKFMNEEKGMLYDYNGDDSESVIEGTITVGRLSEMITMQPKKLKDDFKKMRELFYLYDKKD